mmetsp:Transcript_74083/g.240879  ORF Transcript_74083/g.240879 Transcript_74083/m.240879 type:complete len:224 (-) Transcript_74083:80-751(-)
MPPLELAPAEFGPSAVEEYEEAVLSQQRYSMCDLVCCVGDAQQCRPIIEGSADDGGEVWLHIYDFVDLGLVRFANGLLMSAFDTGAFHTGVEVYGWEWSFGAADLGSGVFFCQPRESEQRCYRQSVNVGRTSLSPDGIDYILRKMEREWMGPDYDLVRKNCCHFSESLIRKIVKSPQVPKFISSLHSTGAEVQDTVGHIGRMGEAAILMLRANIDSANNIVRL